MLFNINTQDITDSFELPGVPDSFQRLWTPQRLAYTAKGTKKVCPFCYAPQLPDKESLIIHRGSLCFVILNLYPYNAGHILVCTYRHVDMYYKLKFKETNEMAKFSKHAMKVLKHVTKATGFNLGMNQGNVGGAGIAEHIHQHIIPRWEGDTNFLPIIAKTRTIASLHNETREKLALAWKQKLKF